MIFCRSRLIAVTLLLASSASLTLSDCACAQTAASAEPATAAAAVSANPQLGTFNKLLQQAGLTANLEGAPVTVFAPSDAAFKTVAPATLDKWARDPESLKAILGYHIVPGVHKVADLEGSQQLTTINGAKLTVSKAGAFLTADEGLVTQPDQPAGNGVVHVLDSVLTPPKK